MDGWMGNLLLVGVIRHTVDKPIKTSNAVVTHIHRQRSPAQKEQIKQSIKMSYLRAQKYIKVCITTMLSCFNIKLTSKGAYNMHY